MNHIWCAHRDANGAWHVIDCATGAPIDGSASVDEIAVLSFIVRTANSRGLRLHPSITIPAPVPAGEWIIFVLHDHNSVELNR